ncbi:hypothetical protein FCH28_08330 [Streptomyces piniterrae]|uniref:Uncharacterized protein n=1 Tax=Streptomyces piniterrae TaxID=2571125 RepID=A0A4U0NSA4_9ACTN|nr:hypothetical protein [Streptomyces piniterrae]TJZ57413.1 hypothetical protein FCH28_08330 [Streptomyces piniterrae]
MTAKLSSITQEIDELQKLRTKLEDLQQHLATAPGEEAVTSPTTEVDTEVTEPVTKPVTIPAARRSGTTSPKAKPAKKAPAKAAGSAKKTRKAISARGKARQGNSTRADRVLGLLDEQPRTVAEMTKLLAQEHPDHTAPETAVRNTLENSLVAKGLAHRSKQGRTVFYSLPAAAPTASSEAPEAGATNDDGEAAPALA